MRIPITILAAVVSFSATSAFAQTAPSNEGITAEKADANQEKCRQELEYGYKLLLPILDEMLSPSNPDSATRKQLTTDNLKRSRDNIQQTLDSPKKTCPGQFRKELLP